MPIRSPILQLGPKAPLARRAVGLFLDRLASPEHAAAIETWRTERCTLGTSLDRRDRASDALAAAYGVAPDQPARVRLAVETYYALVVRRLAERSLGRTDLGDLLLDRLYGWHRGDGAAGEIAAAIGEVLPRGPASTLLPIVLDLYQTLFPRKHRHAQGEHYTPGWLVDHVLDDAGFAPPARLVDPACGAGAFLVAAIGRWLAWGDKRLPPAQLGRAVLQNVAGMDLNPLAVLTSRASYLLALGDRLPTDGPVEIPVFLGDSILGSVPAGLSQFDFVVGNPPWIAWDGLAPAYRAATDGLWRQYGLFSLSASQARHGGGKKDLAKLMVYASADRLLADGGRLAMVLPQPLFQSQAGDGFRRFRIGDGPPLRVLGAHDFVQVRPFQAAARAATLVLEKGAATVYPVPYFIWRKSKAAGHPREREERRAAPLDPDRPSSPWTILSVTETTDKIVRPTTATISASSAYQAHLGANTGGANGVYWVELLGPGGGPGLVRVRNLAGAGKRTVAAVEADIEAELLYPLLRWRDVGRQPVAPSAHILLAQDPQRRQGIDAATMRDRFPRALAYLEQFHELLIGRAAYRRYQHAGPFYAMYDVGPYTVAPIKVVWRRMDRRLRAAMVEPVDHPLLGPRPVVPQETCVLVAVETLQEARSLCDRLNSAEIQRRMAERSVCGSKSFGTPGMFATLGLGRAT